MGRARAVVISLVAILGLIRAPAGFAHYLWIETHEGQARLFFGEYQEGKRERSPGRLDEIPAPRVLSVAPGGESQPLAAQRRADHFALGTVQPGAVLLAVELSAPVQDLSPYGIGIVKPMFYARYVPEQARTAAAQPMTLDILPTTDGFGSFRVEFRGKPLANAKLFVYAPNLWMQELRTDAQGRVRIATPWPGLYVLELVHLVRLPGEFEGKPYAALRHRASLSLYAR